ncbi:GTPase IMAP family member 9-like [Amphiura filiformis]|uniref:GTPase IMAP family member 9-like n=1 Tax=Amphiura filiformis TaxID=82378 RepID=UPI003B21B52C
MNVLVIAFIFLLHCGSKVDGLKDGQEGEPLCETASNIDEIECADGSEAGSDELSLLNTLDIVSPWKQLLDLELQNYPSVIETELRLVLVGRTGEGKTSTANSIVGNKHFEARATASSVTKHCDFVKKNVQNRTLLVVDTPGLFDTKEQNNHTLLEITKSLLVSAPGPHAFLLVLSAGQRFTEEIMTSVELLRKTFGEDVLKYTIVIFTRKDDLDYDNITIEEFLKDAPIYIDNLLEECNRRGTVKLARD